MKVLPAAVRAHRRDRRAAAACITAVAVLLGGFWFARLAPTHEPTRLVPSAPNAPRDERAAPHHLAMPERDAELRHRFDAAVTLLRARQFESAATALGDVLEASPHLPEAHINLGFARLGLQQPAPARRAFETAIGLRPQLANAYYGLAMAHEGQGELELALGAMRTYLHLARNEDEIHLRRARAAVWEWETRLAERRAMLQHRPDAVPDSGKHFPIARKEAR